MLILDSEINDTLFTVCRPVPELDLKLYGLENKSTSKFNTEGLLNTNTKLQSLNDLVEHLKQIYCGNMAAEFMHLEVARLD